MKAVIYVIPYMYVGQGNFLLYNEMLPRRVNSSTMQHNARHLSVPSFTKIALTALVSDASTYYFARAQRETYIRGLFKNYWTLIFPA